MLIRLVPILFIFIAAGLLFCHPSPFREPEYLQKRTRLLHDYQNKYTNLWTDGDFDNNEESDSAYVAISRSGNDSGKVFIRFTHLIASIELSDAFNRVAHIETVNDIDSDGACEIYFVASRPQSCVATGFLYVFRNHKWKLAEQFDQNGCDGFSEMNYVSVLGDHRFKILYKSVAGGISESYEGKIN